jgi:hypothetical protein
MWRIPQFGQSLVSNFSFRTAGALRVFVSNLATSPFPLHVLIRHPRHDGAKQQQSRFNSTKTSTCELRPMQDSKSTMHSQQPQRTMFGLQSQWGAV